VGDARAVAQAFGRLGFAEVIEREDRHGRRCCGDDLDDRAKHVPRAPRLRRSLDQRLPRRMRSCWAIPADMRRNEPFNFSKLVEQFFNEIKECALTSQSALTDLVPTGLDNVGALAH
jgi:hypothetical protein